MMYCTIAFVAATLASSFATSAKAITDFDMRLSFGTGLSSGHAAVFAAAEAFWEGLIIGYKDGVTDLTGLVIEASGKAIDGVHNIVGQAANNPSGYRTRNGTVYATTGFMQFDTADLDRLEADGTLLDVIKHEMAHVIGFGTLWSQNGLYGSSEADYAGAAGVAAYNAEFGLTESTVPLESDTRSSGSDFVHWAETWAGGSNEIMTYRIDRPMYLSNTTLQSFADLGYTVAGMAPVPLPTSGLLLVSAIGGMAIRARTRGNAWKASPAC